MMERVLNIIRKLIGKPQYIKKEGGKKCYSIKLGGTMKFGGSGKSPEK